MGLILKTGSLLKTIGTGVKDIQITKPRYSAIVNAGKIICIMASFNITQLPVISESKIKNPVILGLVVN